VHQACTAPPATRRSARAALARHPGADDPLGRSVAFGKLKSTKTSKARTVRLLAPLADTLQTWRAFTDRAEPTDLVFPGPDGAPLNLDRINNWRGRIFADATRAAGISGARPYDLRHNNVSLLIAPGATVVDVAQESRRWRLHTRRWLNEPVSRSALVRAVTVSSAAATSSCLGGARTPNPVRA
jgi:integrase